METKTVLYFLSTCLVGFGACGRQVNLGTLPGGDASSGTQEATNDGSVSATGTGVAGGGSAVTSGLPGDSASGGSEDALAPGNALVDAAQPTLDSACPTPASAPCSMPLHFVTATRIDVSVSWPNLVAVESGTGLVHLWLLTVYDGGASDGGSTSSQTATVRVCGMAQPPIALAPAANGALGIPLSQTAEADFEVPSASWDRIASNLANTSLAGVLGDGMLGTSAGAQPQTTVLLGLSPSSSWATDPAMKWPNPAVQITLADVVDPDIDAHPGITATARTGSPFVLLPTANAGGAPTVDQLYMVYRFEFAFSGTPSSDCQSFCGPAAVTRLDSQVVGCRLATGAEAGSDCDQATATFLNVNLPVLKIGDAVFSSVVIPDGASNTCADVRNALPL